MLLYTHKGRYPEVLPFRIKMPNGKTRTDPTTFTPEELLLAGYIPVANKPEVDNTKVVEWSSGLFEWVTRDKTEEELKAESEFRRSKINNHRDSRISYGFYFEDKVYDSRPEDQKRISGAAQLAFMAIVAGAQPGDYMWAGADPFGWIAQDNTVVLMDAQTVVEFGKAAAEWERKHIFAARNLKNMETVPENYKDDQWWPNKAY
jgi:hypothetical protein